jgi:hypothetical protein
MLYHETEVRDENVRYTFEDDDENNDEGGSGAPLLKWPRRLI